MPRTDAVHRASEPSLSRQAGWTRGGLPRPGSRTEGRTGHLHGKRRHGPHGLGAGRSRGCNAGEIRGLLRLVPWTEPDRVDEWDTAGAAGAVACGPGTHPGARKRQRTIAAGRARAIEGLCAGRAAREALRIRDDVASFQAVAGALAKRAPGVPRTEEELDHAIRQIVSKAIAPEGVVDLFAAAGLKKPDISILSDEFLAEVRSMPQRNLAVELLRKLLEDEIKTRWRKNLVQARSFAEMLEQAIRRYQNRAIEAAQVIEELIQLAKEMRAADRRGEQLGMSEEELAFYDALETNDSAVKVLGEPTLQQIARELVESVRRNVTIDWTLRENVRAQLRVFVKRILRKYGYPPDKQEKATETVLEQAALLSAEWAKL
jgi:ribosomal protein L17